MDILCLGGKGHAVTAMMRTWTRHVHAEHALLLHCRDRRKNGKHLGVAFRNITSQPLYPTVGLHWCACMLHSVHTVLSVDIAQLRVQHSLLLAIKHQ